MTSVTRVARIGRAAVLLPLGLLLACSPTTATPGPTAGTAAPTSPVARTSDVPATTGADPVASPTAPVTSTAPTSDAPAPGSGAPTAVRLAWLDGDRGRTGLTVALPGGQQRWIPAVPGESAVRSGQGYRWFGADGSAVACRAARRCVAFDAQGWFAVVDGSALRGAYRPDGSAAGWFDSLGRRRTGPAQPPLDTAVAATGADLRGLVEAAGERLPFAGGVTGDPHLVTGGGHRYSVQYTGDFDARVGDPDRRIQLRWSRVPYQSAVSVTSAVAVATSGTVVTADLQGGVQIGGAPVESRDAFQRVRIGPDTWVGVWPVAADRTSAAVISWPDGATFTVRTDPALGLTVVLLAPRRSDVRGLLGTGDPGSNDLVDRDGIALDTESVVSGWNVPQGSDLFADDAARPLEFPAGTATPSERADGFAAASCRSAGVAQADQKACMFDVALTGDERFAIGHAQLSRAATAAVPRTVAARWPAMADTAPASAQRLPELLETTPAAGEQQVWSVPVGRAGPLRLEFVSGCPSSAGRALAVDRPALRVFDDAGRPVSDRIAACGVAATPDLAPGRYRLVVAGPLAGGPREVRVEVTTP